MVLVKKDGCDVQRITSVIESYVPEARMESDVAAELTYILPHDSKAQFQKLFSHIEEQSEDLGISSYGASVTTMEEVFLRYLNFNKPSYWCILTLTTLKYFCINHVFFSI